MKYAIFLGCVIPTEQYHYELSVRAVFPYLGIDLVEIGGYSCCGVPIKGYNVVGWLYLAARNIALAEDLGLDILTLCNGCYNSFIEAFHYLDTRPKVLERVNHNLSIEGLEYKGTINTVHILEALGKNVDLDYLKDSIKYSFKGKKIASHYGCHALRPSNIIEYIDSETPQIMEEFIMALGAISEYYPEKLDCCGSTLTAANYESSFQLTGAKIQALQMRNYDALATVCPFCQKMYDGKQEAIKRILKDEKKMLPVFYLTQLIGIALGLDHESLGLNFNATPVDDFLGGLN